jgi:Icc-related predicted phosphoesterase
MAEALERVRPRLMVCGHIHSAYGAYRLGDTDVVNASLVDDQYRPVHEVVRIEL